MLFYVSSRGSSIPRAALAFVMMKNVPQTKTTERGRRIVELVSILFCLSSAAERTMACLIDSSMLLLVSKHVSPTIRLSASAVLLTNACKSFSLYARVCCAYITIKRHLFKKSGIINVYIYVWVCCVHVCVCVREREKEIYF